MGRLLSYQQVICPACNEPRHVSQLSECAVCHSLFCAFCDGCATIGCTADQIVEESTLNASANNKEVNLALKKAASVK